LHAFSYMPPLLHALPCISACRLFSYKLSRVWTMCKSFFLHACSLACLPYCMFSLFVCSSVLFLLHAVFLTCFLDNAFLHAFSLVCLPYCMICLLDAFSFAWFRVFFSSRILNNCIHALLCASSFLPSLACVSYLRIIV
jgi:hypothetical protein